MLPLASMPEGWYARRGFVGTARIHAALAQLVEHRIRNAGVTGSSPVSGTTFFMFVQQGNARGSCERAFAFGSGLGTGLCTFHRENGRDPR